MDLAIGWTFIVLGTLHNFVGAMHSPELNPAALWFVSGGIALWLIGAMNLLRVYYGGVAPGLRWVCLAANLVVAAFSVTYAAVTGAWRRPLGILLLGTCAGAILMALLQPGVRPGAADSSSHDDRRE